MLATTIRPKTFNGIVGQPNIVDLLINLIKTQNDFYTAALFTGPSGVGKTTVARIIAAALNCKNLSDNYNPCGTCEICIKIQQGIFCDVEEIDAASKRGIDKMKELISGLAYQPSRSKYKIIILDEAHAITKDSGNAFLKTLEEPPSYVRFILCTTNPESLLPTVLSRCLPMRFRPLSSATIKEHFSGIIQKEGYSIEDSSLSLLARSTKGNLRTMLNSLEKLFTISVVSKSITIEDVVAVLDGVSFDVLYSLVEHIVLGQVSSSVMYIDEIFQEVNPKRLLEELYLFFEDLLMLKLNLNTDNLVLYNENMIQAMRKLIEPMTIELLHQIMEWFLQREAGLFKQSNLRLYLESSVIQAALDCLHYKPEPKLAPAQVELIQHVQQPVQPVQPTSPTQQPPVYQQPPVQQQAYPQPQQFPVATPTPVIQQQPVQPATLPQQVPVNPMSAALNDLSNQSDLLYETKKNDAELSRGLPIFEQKIKILQRGQ